MRTLATTAISVLDLARMVPGSTLGETYARSHELAQHVEKLGYTRYWLAEHHNIEGVTSAATAVLIGYVAEHTRTIRVGSGGIMLPNHAPLMVAETFGTLASLYPGRIDLGLGRAPGTDPATLRALRRNLSDVGADFGRLVEELLSYFANPEPGQRVRAIPGAGIDVPIYILGSSLYGAALAARLGRPFAFAGHFAPDSMQPAFEIYRSSFTPSAALAKPHVMLGVPVIAAENDDHADFLASSLKQAFLGLARGYRRFVKPPVKNMDDLWNPLEKEQVSSRLRLLVTGGPTKIRTELDHLVASTGADELVITSDTYDPADRLRSYQYIAAAKAL